MDKKKLVQEIILLLTKKHPQAASALKFRTPFELLCATILSAQSTDVQVNKITERLFRKYKTIRDYANAPEDEFQKAVSSVNFYKNKAKNIQNAAKMIIEKYGSVVPDKMQDLITLPGVARKTANIVLSGAFGINEGIAVDTHVIRLSNRLGLTAEGDPVKIERDLMAITDKKDWGRISNLLILHGRDTCTARAPKHSTCVLYSICPSNSI